MRKILLTSLVCFSSLFGDIIGGEIDLGVYTHSPSGTAQNGDDVVDVEKDLNWESENDIFLRAYLEHPLPLLPNIRVGYSKFSHDGVGTASKSFSWGGIKVFELTDRVESSIDLDIYELGLYYEILDNWLNLDVGLNVKYFDGFIDVETTLEKDHTDLEFALPTLYGKARFDVPTTNLSFQLEGNFIDYDGNTYYDFEAGARYEFMLGFGAEVGYKSMKIKVDDVDDVSMDVDFSGAYGKVVWDF